METAATRTTRGMRLQYTTLPYSNFHPQNTFLHLPRSHCQKRGFHPNMFSLGWKCSRSHMYRQRGIYINPKFIVDFDITETVWVFHEATSFSQHFSFAQIIKVCAAHRKLQKQKRFDICTGDFFQFLPAGAYALSNIYYYYVSMGLRLLRFSFVCLSSIASTNLSFNPNSGDVI